MAFPEVGYKIMSSKSFTVEIMKYENHVTLGKGVKVA